MLLIPLVVCVITCIRLYHAALTSELDRLEYVSAQIADSVDSCLSHVDSLMNQTLVSQHLSTLIRSSTLKENSALITDAMQFKTTLQSFSLGDVLENYLVYFKNPNILFCVTGDVYYEPYNYIANNLRLDDISMSAWYQMLHDTRRISFIPMQTAHIGSLGNVELNVLLYMRPILQDGQNCGSMIGVIRMDSLLRTIYSVYNDTDSFVMWFEDNQGNCIAHTDLDGTIELDSIDEEHGWIVHSLQSSTSYINYYIASPNARILRSVFDVMVYVFIILILALILGLWMAALLARRYGVPLDNICYNLESLYLDSNKYDAHTTSSSKIKHINAYINQLIDDHTEISSYLCRQTGLVERMFFEKLYNGLCDTEQEILEMLNNLHICPLLGPKQILLAQLEPCIVEGEDSIVPDASNEPALDDAGRLTRVLDNTLSLHEELRCHRYDISLNSFALIVQADAVGQDVFAVAQKLIDDFTSEPNLRLRCAISEAFDDYIDVWRHYQICTDALKRSDSSIISATSEPIFCQLAYTNDVEAHLIKLTLTGRTERVSIALDEIELANLHAPAALLTSALSVTLVRLRSQLTNGPDAAIEILESLLANPRLNGNDPRDLLRTFRTGMTELCAALAPRRSIHNNPKLDSIKQYIEKNYTCPELSLNMLADMFHLTPTYLSHAYKEYFGENISGHIEKLRIEQAQQLLKNGNSIEQTASAIGYYHIYSFRTAFKRVTGTTPGAYRDQHT